MASLERFHYVGVAGSGMSALAQFHVMGSGAASGSDRSFDRGQAPELRRRLEALGVRIAPQDGSALRGGRVDAVVCSTAIEDDNPDLAEARRSQVPVIHRADMLARYVHERRTVAVAGTSGKSTVAAMVFEILSAAGREPSIITGGGLRVLEKRGVAGNAWQGKSDLLVVEADESDGTLVRYRPWLGVLLNVERDHKEIPELLRLFSEFRSRCSSFIVHAGSPGLEAFASKGAGFGLCEGAELRGEDVRLEPASSSFTVRGVRFALPAPGRHNVENALAATLAATRAGASLEDAARALASFEGVARRFESIGSARGVQVIDDFAHNPAKVRAALAAARLRGGRVLALFQPHGFAPTRFNLQGFIDAFAEGLGEGDVLWLPEIYYAGGTAQKTVSSRDIAVPVRERGRDARFVESRDALAALVAAEAKPGDVVLLMGARDPTLGELARGILREIEKGI
ncbi:MAG: UDP-N-acetylmuramate--alanine ligase [Elusimicrobia bacterium]|nr:UDP-N-acetylmuramate--alanine ligase [Elusimicrobiota bacterium]